MYLPLSTLSAFLTAYTGSDFLGKLIILSLVSLSILCWVVLIQKVWMTRQIQSVSTAFYKAYQLSKDNVLHLELGSFPKPKNRFIPHPYAEIFQELRTKTTEILNKNLYFCAQQGRPDQVFLSPIDLEIIESHTLTTISAQIKRLEKNLFVLSTITTLAPFLGLLGTVWGILITFSELGNGSAAGSNMTVLGGLSTALATTVMGLIIAIPALIGYNYLKNALKNYASDMEEFLYGLLSTVELQYRRVEG